jgi:hypothetical protein
MEIRKDIEDRNFWYYLKCRHCETVFLVEESIDCGHHVGAENPFFKCYCPRCGTKNAQVSIRRLKLKLQGTAGEKQHDPLTTRLARKLKSE